MIALPLAINLKQAGLVWRARVNDFFAIPDRGMDDRVFVLSDLMANLEILRGWPAVTFHGTSEWALDYILTSEVVWLPREEQLREAILDTLQDEMPESLQLTFAGQDYHCTLVLDGDETIAVDAATAAAAYGQVLLRLLKRLSQEPGDI